MARHHELAGIQPQRLAGLVEGALHVVSDFAMARAPAVRYRALVTAHTGPAATTHPAMGFIDHPAAHVIPALDEASLGDGP